MGGFVGLHVRGRAWGLAPEVGFEPTAKRWKTAALPSELHPYATEFKNNSARISAFWSNMMLL
jgi:hypothetical protein